LIGLDISLLLASNDASLFSSGVESYDDVPLSPEQTKKKGNR
jgi:hypothetical protein